MILLNKFVSIVIGWYPVFNTNKKDLIIRGINKQYRIYGKYIKACFQKKYMDIEFANHLGVCDFNMHKTGLKYHITIESYDCYTDDEGDTMTYTYVTCLLSLKKNNIGKCVSYGTKLFDDWARFTRKIYAEV